MIESVGIIGSGPIGRAVAGHAASAGQRVFLSNSRGPETLTGLAEELGDNALATSVEEAASADIVIMAVPFVRVHEVGELIGDWSGRIVVDTTNEFAEYRPYGGLVDLGDETASEFIARQLPAATVIKAFNAMSSGYLAAEPRHGEGRQVVFYAGDDELANNLFADLIGGWGFAPVFLGDLRSGGPLMQIGGRVSLLHVLKQD